MQEQEERAKALEDAIANIQKNYGKGAIMKLGESMAGRGVEVLPMIILTIGSIEYFFCILFVY